MRASPYSFKLVDLLFEAPGELQGYLAHKKHLLVEPAGSLLGVVGQDRVRALPTTPASDTALGGVPREQKMLKGHLPRVMYHQVY